MKILVLTQWFDPEPAFLGLSFVQALERRGHQVQVATGFPNYPGGKVYPDYKLRVYRQERLGGVAVHRLWLWPSHGQSTLGRVANYLSFFVSALLFGAIRGRHFDVIYVYHPPITPAAAAAVFCWIWRKPFVVLVQDMWPDSVVSSGMAPNWLGRGLAQLCNFVWRKATAIIVQSNGFYQCLKDRGVPAAKLFRIYNWANRADPDTGFFPAHLEPAFEGRFNLVYGGNIGQAQALCQVIRAVAEVTGEIPELHLHLFGNGMERGAVSALAAEIAPSAVTLHGPVDRATMDRIFDRADALVVHLKDDPLYAITLPSKVQHYLACGRPIIAGLDGEAAALLRQSGAALVCAPGDVPAFADAVRQLVRMPHADRAAMCSNGARFYSAQFEFERAVDETCSVLERAAANEFGSIG